MEDFGSGRFPPTRGEAYSFSIVIGSFRSARLQPLVEICPNAGFDFDQVLRPEVAAALDQFIVDDDALLGAQLGDHPLHFGIGHDGVGRAVQDQARGRAGARKLKSYMLVGGETETKPSVSAGASATASHPGPEIEAGHPALGRGGVGGLQPVQGRGRVGQLADALVEFRPGCGPRRGS